MVTRGTTEAVSASFLARSAKATAGIAVANISPSDPTNSIGARDVIEDVEDRIDGFAARFMGASPVPKSFVSGVSSVGARLRAS
jgi:hypothetical protein